ncbi:hypothetical protein LCGC14_1248840 [marine sediment metagenome]|uniref:Uncharacterized protein n=1 Tax=marine sediment metagenome TaxID=412755 RepID=A0A0F9P7M4_9ZZZZ
MSKPKVEYRIVCPNFGTRGHSTHVHPKKTLVKAQERAAAQDRLYEHLAKVKPEPMYSYYRSEIGWRVQTRTITEWEEVNE